MTQEQQVAEGPVHIRELLQSADEEVRREALLTLRATPLSESRALLFTGMGDDSWRVRKEAVDIFVAADPDEASITELMELLRNEENAGLRNSAAEALTRLGNRGAPSLIRMAGDDDADVRKFVIDVMGAIGNPLFLPALLSALRDQDVNVAAAAAEHLGNVGDSEAVPHLIESIVGNDSLFFRFSALAALGKLSSHAAVPDEILALAEDDFLRTGVFDCLGSIGDHSVIPILLQGVRSRQKSSRKAAIASLHRIYQRSEPAARHSIEEMVRNQDAGTTDILIASFDPAEQDLAEAVITLLGIIGDARCAKVLIAAYTDERLFDTALTALRRLSHEAIQKLIEEQHTQADEITRCAICSIIDRLAFRGGSSIIRQALSDRSAKVRKIAVSAAGGLGLTDCIPAIVDLLGDSDGEIKNGAIGCLQVLALIDRDAIRKVAASLGVSEHPELRRHAAILHATLGDGENLSLLLKDEDAGVRQAAVASIGKLRLAVYSGVLQIALVDEDPDVRIAAAEALGEAGSPDVVNVLLPALQDEDCWVQSAALRSIARLAPAKILPIIRSIYPKAEGFLAVTCLELLEQLGGEEAFALVEGALDSGDDDIVRLAVSILSRRGEAWMTENAERLLSHHRETVRSTWAGTLTILPAPVAARFLNQALSREISPFVKSRLASALDKTR